MSVPLREVEHPYMGPDQNYFATGYQQEGFSQEYDSFADFLEEWDDMDADYNHLWRWDWIVADPDDYVDEVEDDPDFVIPAHQLRLFYILQRKGALLDVTVNVQESDDEAVRAFLIRKGEHVLRLWAPILPGS